ncbi:methylated-DNA--[protein]-cysteine S-methyltransferase [Cytobacillus sp. FSL W7-1323]|uniref:Methylated-DNA--protein-cysteine methyltransferase n=1 Tax=Cytobacillus kochii TaxID=859143 RepID=A0A248TI40_9BACI|nr:MULTISPECIES: methylated-DNA--[protein]-cysteine S-methyltransferase [Cytobacillus]ASV67868.1 cysteine methyltransferase [Cytobacillus kochii]MDQ0185956.1 methylated-DNA-[protein]-cysteine S-methyltransferase [Cytobacillus kochii]MEA1853874.1 methylated-DNA--[protein]-cysteine S-methyltransferase [Cytobacillus sp. OWB-43]MED1605161.1 methylated-DNA--[protein]-cysteine S-methyltransferase [Cytobacillus kochii]
MQKSIVQINSPVGVLAIEGTEKAITAVQFLDRTEIAEPLRNDSPDVIKECVQQLEEYFQGKREAFEITYELNGTTFQTNVWQALTTIPFGETASYKDIAVIVGNEKAVRAVGSANGKNKMSIIVPCHRIIGTNGKLTGYAGGMERKGWLLEHERKFRK